MKKEEMLFSEEQDKTKMTQSKMISSKDAKRIYNRISAEKRELLLEKIFFQGNKIKNAAKELGINYSSAKTILHLYRRKKIKQGKQPILPEEKRCNLKFLVQKDNYYLNRGNEITIFVQQGGRIMNQTQISTNPFHQGEEFKSEIIQKEQDESKQSDEKENKLSKLYSSDYSSCSSSYIMPKIEDKGFNQMTQSIDISTAAYSYMPMQLSKFQSSSRSISSGSISSPRNLSYQHNQNFNNNLNFMNINMTQSTPDFSMLQSQPMKLSKFL